MPIKKNDLTKIFDGFIDALAGVVKEKVQLAVESATNEFFNAKMGVKKAVAEQVEKIKTRKRRRRGRPKGSKNKVAPVETPKPKAKRVKRAKAKVIKAEPKPPVVVEPEKTE